MVKLYSNTISTHSIGILLEKIAKSNIKYEYSSVQINLPKSIANKIIAWGNQNISDEDIYHKDKDGQDKYGRENEIHVTVKYGLLTKNIEDIKKAIKNFDKELTITLGKISFFDRDEKDYSVAKIEIEGDTIRELNKLLSNLPNEDENPKYSPHCTISYIKKDTCKDLNGNTDFVGTEIKFDEIEFSSHDGQKHKIKLGKHE